MVGADEAVANEAAAVAKGIKDECEGDLAEALPALEASIQALDTLKPSDISMVKTMKVGLQIYRIEIKIQKAWCIADIWKVKCNVSSVGRSSERNIK